MQSADAAQKEADTVPIDQIETRIADLEQNGELGPYDRVLLTRLRTRQALASV